MADQTPAGAFLNDAKQYRLAGSRLLAFRADIESPIYFLYAHSLELSLKAFLRAHDQAAPRGAAGHDLRSLLEKCQRLGLHVNLDLLNVVELLRQESMKHGFRYFRFESTTRPELDFLATVADELLLRVEKEVASRPWKGKNSAVAKLSVGKPVDKPSRRHPPDYFQGPPGGHERANRSPLASASTNGRTNDLSSVSNTPASSGPLNRLRRRNARH